ncbi:lysophospholipid acyltransferase family protein [Agaribacter flavus]|uniref:L-ornithine N(alpha)-acyltransferase n=1 Tax=Agaribacter flavus TaxID=1902781 RepID=A0ABV7FRJ0_9ALTE
MHQQISILNLVEQPSALTKFGVWLMDQVMGIAKMNALYQQHNMHGLSKEAFSDKIVELLSLELEGIQDLQNKVPADGPVVIASNHPFGGIEGVILARAISEVRPDLKVLANKGLGIFSELSDYFIFTNPLSANDPKNAPSLRQCISHVREGNSLLIFPAGRVSHFDHQGKRIVEHDWNKIVGKLAGQANCAYLPVFVSGKNSDWFYRIEKVYFKLRMFLLGREILNKRGDKIRVSTGYPVASKYLAADNNDEKAELCRALSYAQDAAWRYEWPADKVIQLKPIAAPENKQQIAEEISQLPKEQHLVSFKSYDVYYAMQSQAPTIVNEIARLREIVFREHNEGSGEPIDTDEFDATYTHLFIVNRDNHDIIGAYRMGRTDLLQEKFGKKGLYLSKMFDFKSNFVNQREPSIELGRSFVVPEYQGSYHGLFLLWRGLGSFVCKFPQYRTFYGTVSISKLYDPRSVRLIEEVLIDHNATIDVTPYNSFEFDLHPELHQFCRSKNRKEELSALLQSIESDGKDIPILAKQYRKMGARFHALGIDKSFNHTPGLLLSVDFPNTPDKLLKLYAGEGWLTYRNYQAE